MHELTKITIGVAVFVAMLGMCSLKSAWQNRPLPAVNPEGLYGVFVDDTSGKHFHLDASGSFGVMKIELADGTYFWLGNVTLADSDFYLDAYCNGDGCRGRTTCTSLNLFGPEKRCDWSIETVNCQGHRTAPTKQDRSAALKYDVKCDFRDAVVGECWCYAGNADATSEYENDRVVRKKYSRWMTLRKTKQRKFWRGTHISLERER